MTGGGKCLKETAVNSDDIFFSKRFWAVLLLLFIALSIFGFVKLVLPFHQISAFHALFEKTRPGMTLEEITASMGAPDRITFEAEPIQWDSVLVESADSTEKRKKIWYSFDTFFYP